MDGWWTVFKFDWNRGGCGGGGNDDHDDGDDDDGDDDNNNTGNNMCQCLQGLMSEVAFRSLSLTK